MKIECVSRVRGWLLCENQRERERERERMKIEYISMCILLGCCGWNCIESPHRAPPQTEREREREERRMNENEN